MLTGAIIGCGRVVQVGHLLGFKEVADRIRIVAVADPVAENRDMVGNALGVPSAARFADYRDLLISTPTDFVSLALPHFLHEEVTLACAEAGRHILTEKPLTVSMESAGRVAAVVRRAGIVLGIHHNYHHFPHYSAMRQVIAEGRIGRPFFIRYEGIGGGPWDGIKSYDPAWRTRADRSGGGVLLDNGYHSMYMCEYFMKSPVAEVSARVGNFQKFAVDDLAVVTLTHQNGGISSVQVSWAVDAPGRSVLEVHGTEGSLQVADDNSIHICRNNAGAWQPCYQPTEQLSFRFTFGASFRDFASVLVEGKKPDAGLQDALHNLAIVMAGYESQRVGQRVIVEAIEQRATAK